MPEWVAIASSSELVDGELLGITHGANEILLARIGDEIFAVDNMCTHALAWLDSGFSIPETHEVECPLHIGRFDLRTGAATALPCTDPLRKFEVREDSGQIEVLLD